MSLGTSVDVSWDFCGRPNLSFLTHFHWQVAKYANKERSIAKIFALINIILYEAIGLNITNNVSFEVQFDKEYGLFFLDIVVVFQLVSGKLKREVEDKRL